MFLGEVVQKVERKDEHNVQIRAITFKTNDEEFNETVLDYKGNPQISTMISKLCSYNRRTEFIIKVLVDFIEVDNVEKLRLYYNKEIRKVSNIYSHNPTYIYINKSWTFLSQKEYDAMMHK